MTTLTDHDIQKLAELSKLHFSAEKIPAFIETQKNILSLIAKMDTLNTDEIEPLAHPLSVTQPLRDDVVTEINQREQFQQHAPRVEAGLYIVNKFIENE
ncbi:MAG: asparaginyl/glutamyl-tRNA amidotransferase subunit C [Gammaproteobacteria bacterium RIFCSPHIGHO2_12_FULL_42_13]|nr:MAG: asparaginyl/glutamyl-tRNA amidotransferase subunit C [Gammaproteobacteria bacterium RIFCSPHIGHO2_12_FULL_42_13]